MPSFVVGRGRGGGGTDRAVAAFTRCGWRRHSSSGVGRGGIHQLESMIGGSWGEGAASVRRSNGGSGDRGRRLSLGVGGGEYRESRAEVNIGRHGWRQQGKPRVGTGGECWEVPVGEVSDDGWRKASAGEVSDDGWREAPAGEVSDGRWREERGKWREGEATQRRLPSGLGKCLNLSSCVV